MWTPLYDFYSGGNVFAELAVGVLALVATSLCSFSFGTDGSMQLVTRHVGLLDDPELDILRKGRLVASFRKQVHGTHIDLRISANQAVEEDRKPGPWEFYRLFADFPEAR